MAIVRVGQLIADLPEIRQLDINPLLADPYGVIALDARLRSLHSRARSAGSHRRRSAYGSSSRVLADNAAMLGICRALGFTAAADPVQPSVIRMSRRLDEPVLV